MWSYNGLIAAMWVIYLRSVEELGSYSINFDFGVIVRVHLGE